MNKKSVRIETASEKIRSIEENYSGYTASGLQHAIDEYQEIVDNDFPDEPAVIEARANLEDWLTVQGMAKSFSDLLSVSKSLFLADQMEQDANDLKGRALAAAYNSKTDDGRFPEQVEFLFDGDVILQSFMSEGLSFSLVAAVQGVAIYEIS